LGYSSVSKKPTSERRGEIGGDEGKIIGVVKNEQPGLDALFQPADDRGDEFALIGLAAT